MAITATASKQIVPPHVTPPATWATARELHRNGFTWAQISEQTQLKVPTLRQRASREKWLRARDAVIVIQTEPTRIHPQEMASKSDRLRHILIDSTMRAVARVEERKLPRSMKEERERADLTRTLTAQAEIVCGWSRQDQAAGAIVVGYASQVLGTRTAPKADDGGK